MWCGMRLESSRNMLRQKMAASMASCTKMPPPEWATTMGRSGKRRAGIMRSEGSENGKPVPHGLIFKLGAV